MTQYMYMITTVGSILYSYDIKQFAPRRINKCIMYKVQDED